MRLLPLTLCLLLPLLTACDSNTPRAPGADAPAAVVPVNAPATGTAALPIGAQPLVGTWAADAASCANGTAVTVVSATSFSAGGKSCDIALADNKDGTFSATCGGQSLALTPIFGPPGEGIRVAVGGGKSEALFRCRR